MKFFSNNKKKWTALAALVATIATGSLAYAASSVKQDAYYDTFRFVVNGNEQKISDVALKPFIANSRVYVPMATLNSLGIVDVSWVAAASGQQAVLNVNPKGGDAGQVSMLQQQITALTNSVATKDNEIKALQAELDKYKTNSNNTSSSTTITTEALKKLNDEYYSILRRNDFTDDYKNKDDKTVEIEFGVEATASAYRNELEVEVVTDTTVTGTDWDGYAKEDDTSRLERYIQRNIVDPATTQFKDIKDLKMTITLYSRSVKSSNKIVTATYDAYRDRLVVDFE